jgi:penicillin-binding protein activator
MMRLTWLFFVFILVTAGCSGPQYVRGSEEPALDDYAMSLRLDRRDLEQLYDENIQKLMGSAIAGIWRERATSSPAVVAILPFRNETSEHIDAQLDALLSRIETDLINESGADVLSRENQSEIIAEIQSQGADVFDPSRIADYGRQLGAQYFVTGKIYDSAERVEGERRIQYFMFLQVLDVSTGAIKFQHESALTKGLID